MAFDPDDVPRVTLADSRLKNSTLAISSKGALYKKKKKKPVYKNAILVHMEAIEITTCLYNMEWTT